MRSPRLAIIGSCVTRDIWNLPQFGGVAPELAFVSRTSFASLCAPPVAGYVRLPEPYPEGLSRWEVQMVEDDMHKRGLGRLAAWKPTHLIIDLIDERFDLLSDGAAVAVYSWELHLAEQLGKGPLKRLREVPRASPEAAALWRRGVEAFADFAREQLPGVRIAFHDARWATEWLDADGARQPYPPWSIWHGRPADIAEQNGRLAGYGADLRELLPAAFHIRAPAELIVGDGDHRWGLSPFHYVPEYYRYVWNRLAELGFGEPIA